MANIVVAAIAKWNGSALVKGEKQLTQFQKTTNKLAKSFITLFAAQKIYQFGKASVKAFAVLRASVIASTCVLIPSICPDICRIKEICSFPIFS